MDTVTRYLAIQMVFIFTNYGSGNAQPIVLQPDRNDRYVMDPATFSEGANSNSIWKLALFGRIDPAIYRSGHKIMVNQLFNLNRINPFQV